MKKQISISSIGSISPLGKTSDEIWKNYLSDDHFFDLKKVGKDISWTGSLPENLQKEVEDLKESNSKYRHLDNSVLYAILASRTAFKDLKISDRDAGINIGSSRGATGLFEKYHAE